MNFLPTRSFRTIPANHRGWLQLRNLGDRFWPALPVRWGVIQLRSQVRPTPGDAPMDEAPSSQRQSLLLPELAAGRMLRSWAALGVASCARTGSRLSQQMRHPTPELEFSDLSRSDYQAP